MTDADLNAVTLTGKRFSSRLTAQLFSLQKEGRLCDVYIMSMEGLTVTAHSCVLACASPVLSRCLIESKEKFYSIKTDFISFPVWKYLIDYMYQGETEVPVELLMELETAADILELQELKSLASETREQFTKKSNETTKSEAHKNTQTEPGIIEYVLGLQNQLPEPMTEVTESESDMIPLEQVGTYLIVQDEDGTEHLVNTQSQDNSIVLHLDQVRAVENLSEEMRETLAELDQMDSSVQHADDSMDDSNIQDLSGVEIKVEDPFDSMDCENLPAGLNPRMAKRRKQGGKVEVTFHCARCNKFYGTKQALERHAALHNTASPFTCEHCGKAFKTDRYLSAHVERHKNERAHQCPICSKAFKTKRDANWHQQTVHTNQKRFQCQLCPFKAKTAALLKQHQLAHTAAKEYMCKTCGKAFLRKQHLEQHMVRHEGKRQFMCSVCGSEFYTLYACKEHHVRVHQGLKRFRCAVCHHEYNEKKSFIQHLHKHSLDVLLQVEGNAIIYTANTDMSQQDEELVAADNLVVESVLEDSEIIL